jgi:hypothetical protein
MPVNTEHPEFSEYAERWKKNRTFLKGEDAVKKAGTLFLPMLDAQSTDYTFGLDMKRPYSPEGDYESYKARAMFYNAAGRTRKGLVGAIMRKAPRIECPEDMKEALKTIGRDGEPIESLIDRQLQEQLGIGRVGLLVDASPDEEGTDQLYPFVATYLAESIRNWKQEAEPRTGRMRTTLIVLEESMPDPKSQDDPFSHDAITIYRVLRLGSPPVLVSKEQVETGDVPTRAQAYTLKDEDERVYFQEVWVPVVEQKQGRTETKWVLEEVIVPRMVGGRTLEEIPFQFINSNDTELCPSPGPLDDLISVNESHYRTSADLEHGAHFTALPTAYVCGYGGEDKEVLIGSPVVWMIRDNQAKVGFLEFTGSGLGHLKERAVDKERLMAVLGSRLLEEQKAGVEAAETVKLRTAGEGASLAGIATTASRAWTTLLKWVGTWAAVSESEVEKITVQLNTRFFVVPIDSATMVSYTQAMQGGSMSFETFYFNMDRAEQYPDGWTIEDERGKIQAGPPGGTLGGLPGFNLPPGWKPENQDPEDEEGDEEEQEDEEGEEGMPPAKGPRPFPKKVSSR